MIINLENKNNKQFHRAENIKVIKGTAQWQKCFHFFIKYFHLFCIPTTISSSFTLPVLSLRLPSTLPPHLPLLCSERDKSPMGINKVCHIKLRHDQAPFPASRLTQQRRQEDQMFYYYYYYGFFFKAIHHVSMTD